MQELSGLYYPNRIARAFFSAMDDVMGPNGLSTLLQLARMEHYLTHPPADDLARQFDFAAIAAINEALEEMYGVRGGRGMALRIGQSAFARGLKDFGAMRGINHPAFRNLPLAKRVDYGLRGLAAILSNFSDQSSYVENNENALLFVSEVSPFSWGRTADKPVCHMMGGIILECLRWSSNGYEFYVREVECRATGHERCVFRVNKSAIGERIG
ncbi:MAG: V4R domain-containing protein [Anaerolineae bacterium]